jgi:hypothetical protein
MVAGNRRDSAGQGALVTERIVVLRSAPAIRGATLKRGRVRGRERATKPARLCHVSLCLYHLCTSSWLLVRRFQLSGVSISKLMD